MQESYYQELRYYRSGEQPLVLFLSGMHGDEAESGMLFEEYLLTHHQRFPPFVYIPEVSPSAVKAKTRKNAYGNDINRQFIPDTADPEAKRCMSLIRKFSFRLEIDIHEDPDRAMAFYLYDTSYMTDQELIAYRDSVHASGARLYTGIDDLDDEHLMRYVTKGYITLTPESVWQEAGFSSVWMHNYGIIQRGFTLEIPSKADPEQKRQLLSHVIPMLTDTFVV